MWSGRRRLLILGIATAIAVATFLALVLVPVPQHFSMHSAAIYDLQTNCGGIFATRGTTVNFQWSAQSAIQFLVLSCSANKITYEANGTSGSGAFASSGSAYEFGAGCSGSGPCVRADVLGSFTGPLLYL
jgi:hypothetical protein